MYSFRPATLHDEDFLYQLHRATIRPYVEATWGWDEQWQQDFHRRNFDPTNAQIIQLTGPTGITDAGILVLETQSDEWYIDLIEIAPEYQNQGHGTAILNDLIQQVHSQRRPISLQVLKANTPARRLYERLGFTITNEEEVRYKMTLWPMNNETMKQ
jgi:ribosomal protein S18 acetylase RimI-like enzyme